MAETSIITLLTDFGTEDIYLGVMKGTIAGICPSARLIDLTHQIPPQDITAGAFALLNAYPYFPRGTVHLAVVDPGVGSQRRALALKTTAGYFVGPDNGLFAPSLAKTSIIEAVNLDNPQYWRTDKPSRTFHGRDIFAPVAAHLAAGIPLTVLGSAIDPSTIIPLADHSPQINRGEIIGRIQSIDRFGNLITNIPGQMVEGRSWYVIVREKIIESGTTYAQARRGDYLALIESNGWIEIAVNGGNAREKLGASVGDSLRLIIEPSCEG